ncbi:MAG: hypothetical protein GWP08_08935 [Nitrospiraceae bacterium]|nr:hypothetical protein [Nitrospiraceae bacterium]
MRRTVRSSTSRWTVLLCLAALAFPAASMAGTDAGAGKALVAHWTFDEESGANARDSSGSGCDAKRVEGSSAKLRRVTGVFGNALVLRNAHKLTAPVGPVVKDLSTITLSAWVRPTDLGGYREIFRQECGERILFSFQASGTILSLGLNVDGYEECDARIDAKAVSDGLWHHCAATFDGETMRVYLDGVEVGSLERKGRLVTSPRAPAFLGSLNGQGEYFQGALDDVRLYADALSAKQIAALYGAGIESVLALDAEQERKLNAFYAPGDSLAETLAESRQNLAAADGAFDPDLENILSVKLNAAFPEDCRKFTQWTGMSPAAYLASPDDALNETIVASLLALLTEYRPLTEAQRERQRPEDARRWEEAAAFQRRFEELKQGGGTTRFSPDWIRLAFDCGERIEWRPNVQEAVAPYKTPATPETRPLTADEARDVLERDWLFQADGQPAPKRIRDEIQWARRLAGRIERAHPGEVDFTGELKALAKLSAAARKAKGPDRGLYLKVRAIKRRIMFANPVVDFDRMLFVDMPYPEGSEWPHETRHRLGYMAVPGARLLILDGLSPEGALTQLMPQAPLHGSFWRPDLSFDATKVLFCFKPHNEKAFHLYEINVDGTGLVQLTDGPYDDLDPIYLPDGHILFSTTRGHTYVRCMPPTSAFPLARCDADGRNIYLVSRANEPDYLASVMDDGRVVYTRWEYTDKPLWRAQSLWTMHPDGTQPNTLWGNQSVWPDLLKDARSIPGSRRVMFTGSAHHNWFAGSVGIIDPGAGLNFPQGLTKVTADVEWPESGNGPVDPVESPDYHASGRYTAYYSPYPLSERDFIVSANRDGKFALYLMDVEGNRELIYEGVHNIFHAMPLKPRPRPYVIRDLVDWPSYEERLNPKGGVIFSSNVYQGAPEVLRGKAKYLRILSIEHKTYTYWHKRPYLSSGPVVSGVQSEGVKRVLGTVPIEDDGSVSFHAPSGIPLHFQLLDENHRALQTMRSFTGVMPGERRGCLGCHERHSGAPASNTPSKALAQPPRTITPPPWGEDSVSFARYVRPVLDEYCGKCHQGDGKARKTLDFTPKPGFLGFDEAYWLLTGQPAWGAAYKMPKDPPPGFGIAGMLMVEGYDQRDPAGYQTPPEPMTKLSYTSKLVEIASSGNHHGMKVDPISLRRLILWVDAMCPYRGAEEVRAIPDPQFQGIDWLAVRPQIANAPRIVRPGPIDDPG